MNFDALIRTWSAIGMAVWLVAPAAGQTETPSPPDNPQLEQPEAPPAPPRNKTPKRHTRIHPRVVHHSGNERVEIGKSVEILTGETVPELVVIAGNAIVDGTVQGDLVVLFGSATVNGQVDGEMVTVLGGANLGPQAHINGDMVVVGGPFEANPKATIDGQQTVVALTHVLPNFRWLQGWVAHGLLMARPFPPRVAWVWMAGALFILIYLALAVLFPRPVLACVHRLEEQPIASFFLGILLFVLLGPLMFVLAVSIAGIPVIPFVACALVVAFLFGKVAFYSYAGQQIGRQLHMSPMSLPLVLLLGLVLCYVLYMVPVLGFAVWGVITLAGIGAVLLASFGSFRSEERVSTLPPASVAAVAPAAPISPTVGTLPSTEPPLAGTTEALVLPRVGFWRRLVATFLDFILLGMLIPVTGHFFLAIWAAYHIAMWAWKGTTIGGIVLSIKLVRLDGKPVDFAVALVRSLSSFFSALALFLGFFWAGWDKDRQSWHDKIAGTVMVRVPRGMSLI